MKRSLCCLDIHSIWDVSIEPWNPFVLVVFRQVLIFYLSGNRNQWKSLGPGFLETFQQVLQCCQRCWKREGTALTWLENGTSAFVLGNTLQTGENDVCMMINVRFKIAMKIIVGTFKSNHFSTNRTRISNENPLGSSQAWIWHLLWILLGSAWPLHPCEGQIRGLRLPPRRKSSLQRKWQVLSGYLMSVPVLLKNQVQHSPLWGGGCEDHRISGGQRRNQETVFPLPTVPSLTRTNAGDSLNLSLTAGLHRCPPSTWPGSKTSRWARRGCSCWGCSPPWMRPLARWSTPWRGPATSTTPSSSSPLIMGEVSVTLQVISLWEAPR